MAKDPTSQAAARVEQTPLGAFLRRPVVGGPGGLNGSPQKIQAYTSKRYTSLYNMYIILSMLVKYAAMEPF